MTEAETSHERLITPPYALLLDVDGPVSNPETGITSPEMITAIVDNLKAGIPVALVTGRAEKWIRDGVEAPLTEAANPELLDLFMISSEFGGERVWYEHGERKSSLDKTMELPPDTAEDSKKIAAEFADVMFVDPDKKTMVSVEKNKTTSIQDFKPFQAELDNKLRTLLDEQDLTTQFEVHSDTIATNVRSKESNKRHATRSVLKWLSQMGIKPEKFYAFGDSSSDYEMAEELQAQNLEYKFIFVREREALGNRQDPNIVITDKKFDDGTLDFLNSIK